MSDDKEMADGFSAALMITEAIVDDMEKSCTWTEDSDSGGWTTDCCHYFEINEGSPIENKMAFCCYCGKPLVENRYTENE